MVTSNDLKSEISQLKSDASEKRARRRRPATKRTKDTTAAAPEVETPPEEPLEKSELENLADKLTDLVEDAEHEIKEHPVAMVLGAFALGIVVGAILRR